MLRDLLWFVEAKQQYEIQRSSGLAGCMGLVVTFIVAAIFILNWEFWLNFADTIGLRAFAERVGLIRDNSFETFWTIIYISFMFFIITCAAILLLPLIPILLAFPVAIIWTVCIEPFLPERKEKEKKPNYEASKLRWLFLKKYQKDSIRQQRYHSDLIKKHPLWGMDTSNLDRTYPYVENREEKYWQTPLVPIVGETRGRAIEELEFLDRVYDVSEFKKLTVAEATAFLNAKNDFTDYMNVESAVLAFDTETGKLHYLLSNPLPASVSHFYDADLTDEATLLEALKTANAGKGHERPLVVPSFELKFEYEQYGSNLFPADDAQIEGLSLEEGRYEFYFKKSGYIRKVFRRFVKHDLLVNTFHHVNRNALLFHAASSGLNLKESRTFEERMGDVTAYLMDTNAAIRHYKNIGYTWNELTYQTAVE